MKLDKRACRHAANVPLHISLNAGVLYTERVKYLVTAAVKLLGGHRVLAVYFYECERLKANDRMPKWVVFQGKDTFATLERDAEGNVKWRDAMVQHLTDYYMGDFLQSCVFYKKAGCHTIARYIGAKSDPTKVLWELNWYQQDIRDQQTKIRRYKRDTVVLNKMSSVPQTPANLKRWADKHIMPHYLFYDYNNGRVKTQVYCTYCEKFSVIKRPKNNDVLRCPKCDQKVIAKAQGRRAAYYEDRETCQVVQQISPHELVVRIYKLYWSYVKGKDTTRKSAYEVMRIFVCGDDGKKATIEPYYYSRDYDSVTHWRHGHHPGALFGIECFISEEIGAIYLPGLEKVLYGTLWEYCALRQFYEQTYNPMQVSYYLKMYLQHPLLIERLTKVGFRDIVSDVVYRDGFSDALDETQTKTHRILRVQKEDVSFLLEKNATMAISYYSFAFSCHDIGVDNFDCKKYEAIWIDFLKPYILVEPSLEQQLLYFTKEKQLSRQKVQKEYKKIPNPGPYIMLVMNRRPKRHKEAQKILDFFGRKSWKNGTVKIVPLSMYERVARYYPYLAFFKIIRR